MKFNLIYIALGLIVAIFILLMLGRYTGRKIKENVAPTPIPTTLIPKASARVSEVVSKPVSKVNGVSWYINPIGNDANSGSLPDSAKKTIQATLNIANPGDQIYLADGVYMQDFITKKNGTKNAPITISGTKDAIIKGAGGARIVQINHDYIVLRGFTIDGQFGDSENKNGYRDKLIYVQGVNKYDGVTGLKILNMTVKNAGGECIRLRYFVTQSEIAYNSITSCGHFDYSFDDGGKNGEGIYIGTAPEQRNDGKNPTSDTDESNVNLIHHNTIDTQGNECVDIKEDSKYNIVENNSCTGQKDTESGGLDSRGGYNIFRYNEIFGNLGAGVRLGGDTVDDNINNEVYENIIRDNENGGIKFQAVPQGKICGNTMTNNRKSNAVGEYGEQFNPDIPC